ncbi:MAG: peptide chain release factor N(5)-glutamine methyltransferase [Dehalococcoidia bacterium]|nr:peptide chain release factor N(5)-glutamine methyltransferase [Dehalococcoidia bacterium]
MRPRGAYPNARAGVVAERRRRHGHPPVRGASAPGHERQVTPERPLRERLREAGERLLAVHAADDVDEARLEAELLYGRASGLRREQVIAAGAAPPATDAWPTFEALLTRRLGHEPLAYILGQREFYGLTFQVGPGCLVPRPETETLVEAALTAIREHPRSGRLVRVADAGTGSGAIALSVARHASAAKVFATDIAADALQWAGRNRKQLGLTDRVVLLAGDLLEPLTEPLDIVLANLPYIPTEDFEGLPEVIRISEPRIAVEGGETGLEPFHGLAAQLPEHLVDDAFAVLLEVGAGQAGFVEDIVLAALGRPDARVTTHRDLRGIRRVVEVRVGF